MIERLKSTTNQYLVNAKQNRKENMLKYKDNAQNLIIKRNKRIKSALTSQYSNKIPLEYGNKVGNYKYETIKSNMIKENIYINRQFSSKKFKIKLSPKPQNINSNEKILLTSQKSKNPRKSSFTKFMESVTQRVNQINNPINYSRITKLFCPVYKKKERKDSGIKENEKTILKLKEKENNKFIKTENKDNKFLKKYSIVQLELSDDNSQDNKLMIIKIKESRILSNAYLNNLITKKKEENIIKSKFENKIINVDKSNKIHRTENNTEKNHEDYIKRILGVRYKEYDISNGQKTFSKMIIPYIEDVHRLKNIKDKKTRKNTFEKYKSVKVDLLFYDQLTKKNKAYYLNDILIQKQAKERLFSRNVIKDSKTINDE